MTRYIFGRISGLLFAVVIVTIITFALMHAVPGGPFDEIKQPLPEAADVLVVPDRLIQKVRRTGHQREQGEDAIEEIHC